MARKSKESGDALFHDLHAPVRRPPAHPTVFSPRLLKDAAGSLSLAGMQQDRAYKILGKWADLETANKLPDFGETEVDAIFLKEIFGDALGYALKTDKPDDYQLAIKFHVKGVGPADGAIGAFPASGSPVAVIELKGARTDLDRDKSQGRTAVRQCWDYLMGLPECPWGIVSNFSTIRLYHRACTPRAYDEFTLQELRKRERFNQFYYLFEKGGLLKAPLVKKPRALALLDKTATRDKEVGDELYNKYANVRLTLIDHLHRTLKKPLDIAIHAAQTLLDRVVFIAFCEDRELLPEKTLEKAWTNAAAFSKATNPRWRNFLALFHEVDQGGEGVGLRVGFNGLLFKHDPDVDDLQLDDIPWANAFRGFGTFDFKDDVNVDVLGNLFERSITELEKLRLGGLFALMQAANGNGNGNGKAAKKGGRKQPPANANGESPASVMPKSAQRKRFGIYYTPPAFTGLIVERTVDALARERFVALAGARQVDPDTGRDQGGKPSPDFWQACVDGLRDLKVVDPACGSGAFLIRAYETLEFHYRWAAAGLVDARNEDDHELARLEAEIPDWILADNLFGVDLSQEAVDITRLALWIRSARTNRKLSQLSANIICGNSLVDDPAVHDRAMDWRKTFPDVFARPGDRSGFDCVIGNPPWERVKVQDREFFSLLDPETAQAVSAADRRKRIAAMPRNNPELHTRYGEALAQAQRMLDHARQSGRFPLTGKGDVNTYVLFAELGRSLVAPDGLVGLLVPSGIATDETTKEFFNQLMEDKSLISLYDFENREKVFEDVDSRFKFTALVFGGAERQTDQADFVFFAHRVEEVASHNKKRHILLTAADMKLLNPNTRTCPIFRTRRDADLTKGIYKRVPVLMDENRRAGGNPWGIKFFTMFHQTNDAERFIDGGALQKKGYRLVGNRWIRDKSVFLPLYEAKMVQAFDHRAASVVIEAANWFRQGQKSETSPVEHQNPEFCVMPRWWVESSEVAQQAASSAPGFLAFKNVTSPTNTRSMIAAFIPYCAVGNSAPCVLFPAETQWRAACCLLANLDAYVLDYVARQKIGNVNLNFFLIEQFPMFHPRHYEGKCSWSKRESLEHWISERVLKLSCTAEDMIPLAKACDFKGSRGDGVHVWSERERAQLRAELDAAYFHLYGAEREDVEYILTTFTNTGRREEADLSGDDSPWTRGGAGDLILRAYDDLVMG